MGLQGYVTEHPVPIDDRVDIVNGLWQGDVPLISSKEIECWNAYFNYYTQECRKALECDFGEHTTVREHQDVLAIAKDLENGLLKREIKEALMLLDTQQRKDEIKERMAEGSIRLIVRLTSMIDVGPIPHDRIQGRAPLSWLDEQLNLKAFLENHFKESSTVPRTSDFEGCFTAFNIRRFANLEIEWTNNLVDHLRLIDNDTKLCIFHHVTFLKGQNSAVFPVGFLEETLQTVALLFPRYDKDTRKWLEYECDAVRDSICLDLGLLDCDRIMPEDRRVENFKFWRDELITLKEKFEQPRITSLSQFWHDRRNRAQWYTFWIAILILFLTIFFGLVQSIEGALQVYKAYHPTPG